MARKFPFIDGFDKYTNLGMRWDNNWGYYGSGSWGWSPCTISPTGGRNGGGKLVTNGFAFGHANTGGVERTRGFENKDLWIVGVAMKPTMTSGNGSILWLKANGYPQLWLVFTEYGSVQVWHTYWTGSAYTDEMIAESAGGIVLNGAWNYYELKALAHASAGTVEVRQNGQPTPIISETGVRTILTGITSPLAYYNTLVLGNNKWSISGLGYGLQEYDDLYIDYDTDAEFRGDCAIFSFLPTAQGNWAEWIPSESPGQNFEMVDEATPNETDWVSEGTPDKKDTYTHDPLPVSPDGATIHAVAVSLAAKKEYPGVAEVAPMIRSGGVDLDGDTFAPVAGSYLYYQSFFEEDPGSSPVTSFTVDAVNDLEFGEKVIT